MLEPDGSDLVYATYLMPTGSFGARCVSIDELGYVTVGGLGEMPATPGAYTPGCPFCGGIFVCRLDPTGSKLVWLAQYGGVDQEELIALEADSSGVVTFTGYSSSDDASFPTTKGAYAGNWTSGEAETYVARLSPDGSELLYSTSFGGDRNDRVTSLATDEDGAAVICGVTGSPDFPVTPGAFDPVFAVGKSGFVAKFDLLPHGVAKYGQATPGCRGPATIGVTSMPYSGNASFGLTCSGAPRSAKGWLGVASAALDPAAQVGGVSLAIDPANCALLPVESDASGWTFVTGGIRPGLEGMRVFCQFFWPGDACAPAGISASNALDVTIQSP